jgi:hypothetical protein
MTINQQNLEKKLAKIIDDAKKSWGQATGGQIIEYIPGSDTCTKLYVGKKAQEVFFPGPYYMIQKGEYVVFDKGIRPSKIKIYTPKLEEKFACEEVKPKNGIGYQL